jgi:methyl-accepting chemotaxis protein
VTEALSTAEQGKWPSICITQVNQAMLQLDQVTQRNAAQVEESTAAAQMLRAGAQSLERSVAVFRL